MGGLKGGQEFCVWVFVTEGFVGASKLSCLGGRPD